VEGAQLVTVGVPPDVEPTGGLLLWQALHDLLRHNSSKTILQDLTVEIRVDARDAIEPTFALPAVRPPSGLMEPTGIEPVTFCLQRSPRDT
jgi:hypothetical protein